MKSKSILTQFSKTKTRWQIDRHYKRKVEGRTLYLFHRVKSWDPSSGLDPDEDVFTDGQVYCGIDRKEVKPAVVPAGLVLSFADQVEIRYVLKRHLRPRRQQRQQPPSLPG